MKPAIHNISRMSSFHNTQPRSREERLAAQNKELLEKGRLKTRPGHAGGAAASGSSSLTVPDPTSPMYEPNCFQRDVAAHIKQQKLQTMSKQQVRAGGARLGTAACLLFS